MKRGTKNKTRSGFKKAKGRTKKAVGHGTRSQRLSRERRTTGRRGRTAAEFGEAQAFDQAEE